jgi:Autographiviridae endonuclease VII
VTEKVCTKCGVAKSLEDYHKQAGSKDGKRPRCKPCTLEDQMPLTKARYSDPVTRQKMAAYNKARWASDEGYNAQLKRQYNITLDIYNNMLAAQGGVCAICGGHCNKRMSVDHDHRCCPGKKSCGKCIRGLLCSRCNHGIGLLGDSAERLLTASRYVEQNSLNGGRI